MIYIGIGLVVMFIIFKILIHFAPEGFQDKNGFHYGNGK
jgi:hypothetical protein